MENGYQKRSKYSMLKPEEIMREKRKVREEWYNKLSEEKKQELKEKMQDRKRAKGICEICGNREYVDLYQHRRSNKHKENEKKIEN